MMINNSLIVVVSQDVIFKPFFVSNLISILEKENIKISLIVEVSSKNISSQKEKGNIGKTWSFFAIVQFGFIFIQKKITSILPIPLSLKWKSTVKLVAKKNEIPYKFINDLNKFLSNLNLKEDDLVFSFQHQIIKKTETYKASLINCHPGDVSKYRGIKPIFWSMLDKNKVGQVSVHFIDSGIDTGNLISKKEFPFNKSLGDNYYEAYKVSSLVAADAIKKLKKKEKIENNPTFINPYSYKSQPNRLEIKRFYNNGLKTRLSFINFIRLLRNF